MQPWFDPHLVLSLPLVGEESRLFFSSSFLIPLFFAHSYLFTNPPAPHRTTSLFSLGGGLSARSHYLSGFAPLATILTLLLAPIQSNQEVHSELRPSGPHSGRNFVCSAGFLISLFMPSSRGPFHMLLPNGLLLRSLCGKGQPRVSASLKTP